MHFFLTPCACTSLCVSYSERKLATVALPCIHTARRSFPVETGAHLALRTVRRFLEQCNPKAVERIVFVVYGTCDAFE